MSFLKVFQFAERGMWLSKKRKRKKEKKDNPCSLAKVFSKFQTRET
jgi:hypothetical protein